MNARRWAIVLAVCSSVAGVSAYGKASGANGPQNGGPSAEDLRRARFEEVMHDHARVCAKAERHEVELGGCPRLVPAKIID